MVQVLQINVVLGPRLIAKCADLSLNEFQTLRITNKIMENGILRMDIVCAIRRFTTVELRGFRRC